MSQRHELAVVGLYTGPNALRVPEGALLEADNVMSVRPDLLEYRPGFARDASAAWGFAGHAVLAMFPYDDDILVYSDDESDGTEKRFDWADSEASVSDLPSETRFVLSELSPPRAAEMRRNLYLTTAMGTRKLTSASSTAMERTGVLRPILRVGLLSTASGVTPIADGNSYATRALIRRTDANDVIVRGPPSISYARSNSSGAAIAPSWSFYIPTGVEAGDVFELYRTKVRTGTDATARRSIGAEFFLAQEYTVTAADVTNGYVTILDRTLEADLGAALYTNVSREGELKANDIPPACVDLVAFGGCLWHLNCWPQQRMTRRLVDVLATDDGLTYVSKANLVVTSASAVITGFADTDEIHVGMALGDAANSPTVSTLFPQSARVLSKTSTEVTMTSAATGSDAAATLFFHDCIRLGMNVSEAASPDLDFEVFASDSAGVTSGAYRFTLTSGDPRATQASLVVILNRLLIERGDTRVGAHSFTEDAFSVSPGTVLLEEQGVGSFDFASTDSAVLQFACTAPAAFADQPAWTYDPNTKTILPESYYSIGLDSCAELSVARYSKPDQPEHVPALNAIRLGDARRNILRGVALENALIVFKEDGIYRITGVAPDSWTVTVLDAQTRLLSASAVCVIGNEAYAWTDRGVVVVSETGVRPLSEPVVGMGDSADELKVLRQDFTRGNTIKGCFMVAWPTRGLVCLAVPEDDAAVYSHRWWVYSLSTQTWSRFLLESRCAAFSSHANALYIEYGRDGTFVEIRKERTGYDDADMADDAHAITIASVPTSTTFTVNTTSNLDRWVPVAGDIVEQTNGGGTTVHRVISASSALVGETTVWTVVLESSANLTTGAATAYETIPASIAWRPLTAGTPKQTMLLREACFAFREVQSPSVRSGSSADGWRAFFGGKTDREATTQETEIDVSVAESAKQTVFARCWPKRAIARCAHLYPRLRIQDRVKWHLSALSLELEGAPAGRVKR